MGRLHYTPSDVDNERAYNLAAAGVAERDIAALMQLPPKTLRRVFRQQLRQGEAEGNKEVLAQLYEAAKSGSNTSAAIFWAKAKCGWRDTGVPAGDATAHSTLIIERVSN